MGNNELDQLILAACGIRWLKVARIIAEVGQSTGLGNSDWGYSVIARRVRWLVSKGKLQAVGNLWNWRASEIRLPFNEGNTDSKK